MLQRPLQLRLGLKQLLSHTRVAIFFLVHLLVLLLLGLLTVSITPASTPHMEYGCVGSEHVYSWVHDMGSEDA